MNQRLKFSWGHIVAFMALIFIAYVVFMGESYHTLGDYAVAGAVAAVCVALLVATLIGAQQLKGTDHKFYKFIKWERALIFLSPLMLLITFLPFNHFWSVYDKEDEITGQFKTSIVKAHKLFEDYEAYAAERRKSLERQVRKLYPSIPNTLMQNHLDEFDMYFTGENYVRLRDAANSWIDNAAQDPTVWNVFLFGNVDHIEDAVRKWASELETLTAKKLKINGDKGTREEAQNPKHETAEPFSQANPAAQEAAAGLEEMKKSYQTVNPSPKLGAALSILLCYLMLLLPYWVQERCTKSTVSLFSNGKKGGYDIGDKPSKPRTETPNTPQSDTTSRPQPARKGKGGRF